MSQNYNIVELLTMGRWKQHLQHKKGEEEKVGNLRAGNSGTLLADGTTLGKCPRLSLLRALGVDYQIALNKQPMLAGGVANEDILSAELALSWNGLIKREEEIPIRWEAYPNIFVTGRPDVVLCDKEGKPVQGVECKAPSSMWTAIAVHLKRIPKSDHLIQAAHYSMILDIPFTLLYTSRVNWALQGNQGSKDEPWKTWKGVEYTVYNDKKTGQPAVRTVTLSPFDAAYELKWEGNDLYVKHFMDKDFTKTLISKDGIHNYYAYVGSCMANRTIPTRPSKVNVFGKIEYNPCDKKYCPYTDICESGDKEGFDSWLDRAKILVLNRSAEIEKTVIQYLILEREKHECDVLVSDIPTNSITEEGELNGER